MKFCVDRHWKATLTLPSLCQSVHCNKFPSSLHVFLSIYVFASREINNIKFLLP